MKLISAKVAAASLLVSAALSGCVVAPAPYRAEVVAYAPPPVPFEAVVGIAPAPGYFWIGGSYFWEGGRYVWHPGYWQAPRPGYHWVPHAWVHANNGWHMRQGHWVAG
ncbi:MAG TPA: hypothetical protein VEK10_06460 [Steroidobacteraceae bacterium]|nr:hypothetical protein [Steroidobacteraceae bacterium]